MVPRHDKPPEPIFPIKLHRMLSAAEAEGFEDVISWYPDGKSFRVHDKGRFEQEVMPKYFGHTKYRSFQKCLNMWDFSAVRSGEHKGRCSHPLFLRCHQFLCQRMSRRPAFSKLMADNTKRESTQDLSPAKEAAFPSTSTHDHDGGGKTSTRTDVANIKWANSHTRYETPRRQANSRAPCERDKKSVDRYNSMAKSILSSGELGNASSLLGGTMIDLDPASQLNQTSRLAHDCENHGARFGTQFSELARGHMGPADGVLIRDMTTNKASMRAATSTYCFPGNGVTGETRRLYYRDIPGLEPSAINLSPWNSNLHNVASCGFNGPDAYLLNSVASDNEPPCPMLPLFAAVSNFAFSPNLLTGKLEAQSSSERITLNRRTDCAGNSMSQDAQATTEIKDRQT